LMPPLGAHNVLRNEALVDWRYEEILQAEKKVDWETVFNKYGVLVEIANRSGGPDRFTLRPATVPIAILVQVIKEPLAAWLLEPASPDLQVRCDINVL
jgi:hypothetical protein